MVQQELDCALVAGLKPAKYPVAIPPQAPPCGNSLKPFFGSYLANPVWTNDDINLWTDDNMNLWTNDTINHNKSTKRKDSPSFWG